MPLKKKLLDKGYVFVSETDTEVLAHLLDYYYKGNPLEAITKVLHRVEGSYALGIMFAEHPDVFLQNTRMFYPKTWGCFAPLHPDVLGENMGMFWVLTPIL